MILRPQCLPVSLVSLFLFSTLVSAQSNSDPFQCHVNVNSLNFDLTKLVGEHTVSRTRETPPSTMVDTLRFDLCSDLKPLDGVAEGDQCPSGTRVCLTKVNKKGDNSDRVVAVIPMVESSSSSPQASALTSPRGLSLIFYGPIYPPISSTPTAPQCLNLTLLCSDTATEPTFTSYNGTMLNVEWSHSTGCGSQGSNGGSEDESNGGKEKSVGSGIGWFFLVLLLAIIAYFGLGAYYNYSTYGASGIDLIPHRDFWQEVPYMAKDVISHLCSSVRPRRTSSRGGYIAV